MILAQSAEVTSVGPRTLLVLVFIAVVIGAVWMMRRSWLKKQSVQSEIASPLSIPADFVADHEVAGRFLATSAAGAWLTRITVHTLGVPSRAVVKWGRAGVVIERPSALSFFIPLVDLVDVRADRAIAGRAFERDGIVVLTWKLGDVFVESGLRADSTEGHLLMLKMMAKQESGA